MELVEVDAVDAQALEAALALRPYGLGAQVRERLARGRQPPPALGEDEDVLPGAPWFQRPADDLLRVPDAVGRRGVDPVDARLDPVPDGGY